MHVANNGGDRSNNNESGGPETLQPAGTGSSRSGCSHDKCLLGCSCGSKLISKKIGPKNFLRSSIARLDRTDQVKRKGIFSVYLIFYCLFMQRLKFIVNVNTIVFKNTRIKRTDGGTKNFPARPLRA
jgi:hypothetical protein